MKKSPLTLALTMALMTVTTYSQSAELNVPIVIEKTDAITTDAILQNEPTEEKPLIEVKGGASAELTVTNDFSSNSLKQSIYVHDAELKATIGGKLNLIANDNSADTDHSENHYDGNEQTYHPNPVEVIDGSLNVSAESITLQGKGKNSRALLITGASKNTHVSITSKNNTFEAAQAVSVINPKRSGIPYEPVETTLNITATGKNGNKFIAGSVEPYDGKYTHLLSSLKAKQGSHVTITALNGKNTFTTSSHCSETDEWTGLLADSNYSTNARMSNAVVEIHSNVGNDFITQKKGPGDSLLKAKNGAEIYLSAPINHFESETEDQKINLIEVDNQAQLHINATDKNEFIFGKSANGIATGEAGNVVIHADNKNTFIGKEISEVLVRPSMSGNSIFLIEANENYFEAKIRAISADKGKCIVKGQKNHITGMVSAQNDGILEIHGSTTLIANGKPNALSVGRNNGYNDQINPTARLQINYGEHSLITGDADLISGNIELQPENNGTLEWTGSVFMYDEGFKPKLTKPVSCSVHLSSGSVWKGHAFSWKEESTHPQLTVTLDKGAVWKMTRDDEENLYTNHPEIFINGDGTVDLLADQTYFPVKGLKGNPTFMINVYNEEDEKTCFIDLNMKNPQISGTAEIVVKNAENLYAPKSGMFASVGLLERTFGPEGKMILPDLKTEGLVRDGYVLHYDDLPNAKASNVLLKKDRGVVIGLSHRYESITDSLAAEDWGSDIDPAIRSDRPHQANASRPFDAWARYVHDRQAHADQSIDIDGIEIGANAKLPDTGSVGHLLSGVLRYSRGHGDLGARSSTKDHRYDAALFDTMSITDDVYADLGVSYRHRRAEHKADISGTEIGPDVDPILKSRYNRDTFQLSAETGWRVPVLPNVSVTPQAQVVWAHVGGYDFTDAYGVKFDGKSYSTTLGRLGIEADAKVGEKVRPTLGVHVWHAFNGRNEVSISQDTYHHTASDKLRGTWTDIRAGITVKPAANIDVHAKARCLAGHGMGGSYRFEVGLDYVW